MSIEKGKMPRHNVRGLPSLILKSLRRGDINECQPGDLSVNII